MISHLSLTSLHGICCFWYNKGSDDRQNSNTSTCDHVPDIEKDYRVEMASKQSSEQQIQAPEELHPHRGDWLREIVFGLNDGLVTTLVFIMTVSSVAHGPTVVLVALSEVAAGGISMTLGGYLAAHTEQEVLAKRIDTERYEIEHEPSEERAELRAIYQDKGLRDDLLNRVVGYLTADKGRWHHAMIRDELGIVHEEAPVAPWIQALFIGGAFVVGGLMPTLPFVFGLPQPRICAYGAAALLAIVLGSLKSRYTLKGPLRSGLEFLLIVTIGTLAGIGIGLLVHAIYPI
jgi:VIT1/CCC1 family predicted Fe2+/Mn2+ transporter